jgi:hypothetical protein
VYQIDKDGNVTPKLDANGYPVPTLARDKESRLSAGDTTITYGSDATGGSAGGGSGALSLNMTTDYLNGLDPSWIQNTGTGQVMTGSPWAYGLDIDGKIGDPVTSPVTGVVVRATNDQSGSQKGFGNNVVVLTSDGKYIQFSHLDSTMVTEGQKIKQGDTLGALGNTGYVIAGKGGDGSHLDVTMWNNFADIKDKEAAIASLNESQGSAKNTELGYKPITTNSTKQADKNIADTANTILEAMMNGMDYEAMVDEGIIGGTTADRTALNTARKEFKAQGLKIKNADYLIDTIVNADDLTMDDIWAKTSKSKYTEKKAQFVAELVANGMDEATAKSEIDRRFPTADTTKKTTTVKSNSVGIGSADMSYTNNVFDYRNLN